MSAAALRQYTLADTDELARPDQLDVIDESMNITCIQRQRGAFKGREVHSKAERCIQNIVSLGDKPHLQELLHRDQPCPFRVNPPEFLPQDVLGPGRGRPGSHATLVNQELAE
jgi:hypothetical protein